VSQIPPGGGILLVDKPEGPTSHDVVGWVRRALRERRVGHTGTLDPFASGLLVLCVGPATRLVPYLVGADKTYVAEARLGVGTDTLDREGAPVTEDEVWAGLSETVVVSALAEFQGDLQQVPPAFSAKKVGGEAAHRKARRGEAVKLDPISVTIHEIEALEVELPRVRFRVRVSSGTYIRALARDLGTALGTAAHLTHLRRTAVGPWSVEEALSGDPRENGIPADAWISPLDALVEWPRLALGDEEALRLAQGQRIRLQGVEDGPVAAHWKGSLLAVCDVVEGVLRPRRVFPPPATEAHRGTA
jgi:tRNA pseudouridine55 synthase